MKTNAGGKLLTLEAGRFFAAAAVMLFHYTAVIADFRGVTVFDDIFRPGHVGVPYFFVLSGFIIYHVHQHDIGQPGAFPRFAAKRAIRLYPMFWMISLVMLAGFLLVPSLAAQRQIGPIGTTTDFLLLPHADSVLAISWTLRHEMVFYALFSLALWFGPRAFWAIAAWIAVSLVGAGLHWDENNLGGWSVIASPLNLGFGFGMIVAELVRRAPFGRPGAFVAAGALALLLLSGLEWRLGHGVPHAVSVLGIPGDVAYLAAAAILIYGLVQSEGGWRLPAPGLWKTLGGSSYLLYLVHQPLGSIAFRVIRPLRTMPPGAAFITLALLAIAVAIVLHLTIERWILARLSRALGPGGPKRTLVAG